MLEEEILEMAAKHDFARWKSVRYDLDILQSCRDWTKYMRDIDRNKEQLARFYGFRVSKQFSFN
jgi:hypothetical protein